MSAPVVVFRTDVGRDVGLGHLRRCLAVARALGSLGARALFCVDGDVAAASGAVAGFDRPGIAARRVDRGRDLAETTAEARGAHAVVVDSYAVGTPYLAALVEAGCRVVVIDDDATRGLPVDIVVNPSAVPDRPRYRGASRTRYLVGPEYAMLQPEFAEAPVRDTADRVRRVLITLGGGDPGPLAASVVEWTAACLDGVTQDVVVGPWRARGADLRAHGDIRLHEDPRDMRALMVAADVAISAGGQTAYELAATGTPTVAICRAPNQRLTLETLARAGALVDAREASDPALPSTVASALQALAKDHDRRAEMARRARATVDGRGALRVAREILGPGAAA